MVAMLVWESARGEVEFLLGDTVTVGREEDADVQIAEPLVSRMHARIERRGEGWFVLDLGSTNLTRVNGSVIREKELHPGDTIEFARARCRFADGAGRDHEGRVATTGAGRGTEAPTGGETPGPMAAVRDENAP